MNDYWNGRVAVITGATHGIGLRLAERLSAKGVNIAALYRNNDDRADNLKKTIENNGGELYIIKGDIIDKNNIKKLIEGAVNKWNRIDFLINNIGIDITKEIYNVSEEEWITAQEIMLNAPFRTIKLCLPIMRKQKFGRIVNMGASSKNYMKGQAGLSPFGVNKAALNILTQTVALEEIKNGITSNMVAPGSTAEAGVKKEEDRIPVSQIPIGRRIDRDEITDGILFFLSENAKSVTGQFLGINGGCSV
jgi:3-oxoacyl-[acyl-carrier protein] reductase